MRVHLVAAPLMARSGVYNSLFDLIEQARAQGLPWTATVGMRPGAPGTARHHAAVCVSEIRRHGLPVIPEIREVLASDVNYARADWVITLISQSDMAVYRDTLDGNRERSTWIAYIRGLPWPAAGEQSSVRRQLLRFLETISLRRAREVWVTTETLAEDVRPWASPRVVRPGIKSLQRCNSGGNSNGPLVWAGRLDVDKRPGLFAEICEQAAHTGHIFGDGPLRESLAAGVGEHCKLKGWAGPDEMWRPASIFVGTSYREAFGRSAVEASLAGLPIVIGDRYGAARMLVTDPDIAKLCVVRSSEPKAWSVVVRRLLDEPELLSLVAEHVHSNAQSLTMAGAVAGITERLTELRKPVRRPGRPRLKTRRRIEE